MKSETTPGFWRRYERLPAEAKQTAQKAFALWLTDHYHPSLDFRRLENSALHRVKIGDHYRALGRMKDADTILWHWIGAHEQYNNLIRRR